MSNYTFPIAKAVVNSTGGGSNVVDLGTLTPMSETTFNGFTSDENLAKLATPNTVVKVSIAGISAVFYGLISDLEGFSTENCYATSIVTDTTYNTWFLYITINKSTKEIKGTAFQQRKIKPVTGVQNPDDTSVWQDVNVADQNNQLYVQREVPLPTASDAGKVPVVNAAGDGYELKTPSGGTSGGDVPAGYTVTVSSVNDVFLRDNTGILKRYVGKTSAPQETFQNIMEIYYSYNRGAESLKIDNPTHYAIISSVEDTLNRNHYFLTGDISITISYGSGGTAN